MARTASITTLDSLPLFSDDQALAEAIVGKKDADKWRRERLPTLEGKPGFPKVDPFHGGRAVPLVRRFYENYLGLPAEARETGGAGEGEGTWTGRSRRRA